MMENSVNLFENFTLYKGKYCVEIICGSLQLSLNAIAHFQKYCPDDYPKQASENEALKCLDHLDSYLRLWISDKGVIGGLMFGGQCHYPYSEDAYLEKGDVEMRVSNTQ